MANMAFRRWQEEARKRREEKQMSLEKMAVWKQDNEKSLEEKERQKHIEMQRDQELIVKARLAVEEQERKRLIAMEILKAKMQVIGPHLTLQSK